MALSFFSKQVESQEVWKEANTGRIASLPCGRIDVISFSQACYKSIVDSGEILSDRIYRRNPLTRKFDMAQKKPKAIEQSPCIIEPTSYSRKWPSVLSGPVNCHLSQL